MSPPRLLRFFLGLVLVAVLLAGTRDAAAESLQALADAGTTEGARGIVKAAVANEALREEAAALLSELGDVAVPALIEAKAKPHPLQTRKWAIAVLEAMNKKVPGEAVQTKNGALLVEVLQAYGKTRDLDALGAVFAFANSDHASVREASRSAISQYGNDALPKLRETYSNLKNAPPPDAWTAADLTRELFRAMDHARLRDLYGMFDDARSKASQGKDVEGAVALLEQVFARAPAFDRRVEAVPIYVQYAQSWEERDPARARDYYQRARRLAEGTDTKRIDSAIAWLDGKELAARGIVSRDSFELALTLDPENTNAKAELSRLDAEEQSRARRLRVGIALAAVIVLLITAAILFMPRWRRTRTEA